MVQLDPFTMKVGGRGLDLRPLGHMTHVSRISQLRWTVERYNHNSRRLIGTLNLDDVTWRVRDGDGAPLGEFATWRDAIALLIED